MSYGSTAGACRALLARDLRLVWRRRGDALNPALFAIMVVALFPSRSGPSRRCCNASPRAPCWWPCCWPAC